jgi:hypothetical protein
MHAVGATVPLGSGRPVWPTKGPLLRAMTASRGFVRGGRIKEERGLFGRRRHQVWRRRGLGTVWKEGGPGGEEMLGGRGKVGRQVIEYGGDGIEESLGVKKKGLGSHRVGGIGRGGQEPRSGRRQQSGGRHCSWQGRNQLNRKIVADCFTPGNE